MSQALPEFCYICGTQLFRHNLRPGEIPPSNHRTRDHVPPSGLFIPPKPSNLITVPCCFNCNNRHSGFDERLRLIAATPFDRNQTGHTILNDHVFRGTLAEGRQMRFAGELLSSIRPVEGNQNLIRMRIDAGEFYEGMIRITKGLLFSFHRGFDYGNAKFEVIDISPSPSNEQSKLIGMLMQTSYFERGQKTFQCWHYVDRPSSGGAWMLIFYQCFGFFVFHTNTRDLIAPTLSHRS